MNVPPRRHSPGIALALLTPLLFAASDTAVRSVAECTAVLMLTPVIVMLMAATPLKESVTPLRWVLVNGAFVGVLGSLAALPAPSIAVLLGIGVASTAGHLWPILAFEHAPVSPLLYFQIAAAVVFSGWLMGRWPDAWGWVGIAIVATCGAGTARLNAGPH